MWEAGQIENTAKIAQFAGQGEEEIMFRTVSRSFRY